MGMGVAGILINLLTFRVIPSFHLIPDLNEAPVSYFQHLPTETMGPLSDGNFQWVGASDGIFDNPKGRPASEVVLCVRFIWSTGREVSDAPSTGPCLPWRQKSYGLADVNDEHDVIRY